MRYKLYNMFIDKFSVTYKVTEEHIKKKKSDIFKTHLVKNII